MLDQLLGFFTGHAPRPAKDDTPSLQLAVAALLAEAAFSDDGFTEEERTTIERLLADRFRLGVAETRRLVEEAERRAEDSVQLFGFTSTVVKQLDESERVRIIEMLWEVVYADGTLDPHEDALIRRVAGLIHVPDRERSLARRRTLDRLGFEG